ncbi:MAG: alpha-amylase family glycosyl hydrolase, partial [Spirochaetales bacterium]
LDGVFNHSSRGFYEFQQTMENGSASPYLDWFHFERDTLAPGVGPDAYPEPRLYRERKGSDRARAEEALDGHERDSSREGTTDDRGDDHPNAASLEADTGLTIRDGGSKERYGYHAWWDIPALPKFNTDTPAVREFLLSVAEYWIKRGIDGWRLDVPGEIDDDEFWREFRRRVKAVNPDAYIVGEVWTYAERWLAGDQFDAVMNYVFNRLCYQFFGGGTIDPEHNSPGGHKLEPIDAEKFETEFEALRTRYPEEITRAQLNLLSSHDEPRFLTVVSGDQSAFRLATAFQMTTAGAPCVYYGDEIGMTGGSDPECRRTFPEERSRFDEALLEYTAELIALRHRCIALRRGSHHTLIAEAGVYGFLRSHRESWAVVLFNTGNAEWSGKIDVSKVLTALPGDAKRPAFDTHEAEFGSAGFTFESGAFTGITLAPRSVAVFAG